MSAQYTKTAATDPLIKSQDQKHFSLSSSSSSNMTSLDIEESEMEKEAQKKKVLRAALFKQIRMFSAMIVIDIGLPLGIYFLMKNFVSELIALIISGIPPLLHVIVNFIRKRRIEVIGCICIFSFVLSGILSLISGNARIALLRDSTTTAVIALAFLATLIPLRTPWFKLYPMTFLIYHQVTSELPPFEWVDYDGYSHSMVRSAFYWEKMPNFRRHNYISTAAWGTSLLIDFIAKVIMIEATTLSVDVIMLAGTIIMGVLFITVAVGSTVGTHRLIKRCGVFSEEWLKANDFSSKLPQQQQLGSENSV